MQTIQRWLTDVILSLSKDLLLNFKNLVVVAPLRRGVSLASKWPGPNQTATWTLLTQQNVNYYKNGK